MSGRFGGDGVGVEEPTRRSEISSTGQTLAGLPFFRNPHSLVGMPQPPASSAPRRKPTSAHFEHELKLVAACPVMASLTLLRGRWKLPLIWNMREERKTLATFRRAFPIASEKMLAQHLGELVLDGFVERRKNPRDRLDVSYGLTAFGRSLVPVVETLETWGKAQDAIARATTRLRTAG